jgi:gas vesicle protein
MKKESERFREEMKGLREEAQALREKIKKAIREALKGEGKPTPDKIKEVVKQFEDEAKAIATKIADARIKHHENIVSILKNEKGEMVDRLTKMLLRPGMGRHRGRGKGEGKGKGKGEEL